MSEAAILELAKAIKALADALNAFPRAQAGSLSGFNAQNPFANTWIQDYYAKRNGIGS